MIDPSARIHPTADLEDGVSVGARSSVWHRAQLRTGAHVGEDCVIGRDAFIDEQVVLGDRVKVQNAALIYHGVIIDDGVFIGPNAILTNDRHPRAEATDGSLARAEDWHVDPIHVASGASIGAGAVIVAGTTVGRSALVGAGAVVTRDVPAFALVVGNPARAIGWVCACGRRIGDAHGAPLPAAFEGEAACTACATRYRIEGGVCERLVAERARP